jgi:hypothetical protein
MSKPVRKLIRSECYEGRTLEARFMGPDLLGYCVPQGQDPVELAGFFIDAQAAIDAGKRFVDAQIKAQKERDAKSARTHS